MNKIRLVLKFSILNLPTYYTRRAGSTENVISLFHIRPLLNTSFPLQNNCSLCPMGKLFEIRFIKSNRGIFVWKMLIHFDHAVSLIHKTELHVILCLWPTIMKITVHIYSIIASLTDFPNATVKPICMWNFCLRRPYDKTHIISIILLKQKHPRHDYFMGCLIPS